MALISSIAVGITANTAGLRKGLSDASRQVHGFGSKIDKALKPLSRFSGALTSIVGVSGAFAISRITSDLDNLAKTSDKLGIASEQLAAFRHAAELSGMETRTFDMALQRMVRRIGEASRGTGEAKDAIRELGLSTQEFFRASPDNQMRMLADAFQKVEHQSDRVRLAFKLADSEGVGVVNLFKDGAAGIDEMTASLGGLEKALDRESLRRVEQFNDAIATLRRTIGITTQSIVIDIAPKAASSIEALAALVENRDTRTATNADVFRNFFANNPNSFLTRMFTPAIAKRGFARMPGSRSGFAGKAVPADEARQITERMRIERELARAGAAPHLQLPQPYLFNASAMGSMDQRNQRSAEMVGKAIANALGRSGPSAFNAILRGDTAQGFMALRANMREQRNVEEQQLMESREQTKLLKKLADKEEQVVNPF